VSQKPDSTGLCQCAVTTIGSSGKEGELTGGSGRDVVGRRQARERLLELFAIERLDQKAVHAGLKASVAVLDQRVRGQRQDRGRAPGLAGFVASDAFGGFDTVERAIAESW